MFVVKVVVGVLTTKYVLCYAVFVSSKVILSRGFLKEDFGPMPRQGLPPCFFFFEEGSTFKQITQICAKTKLCR